MWGRGRAGLALFFRVSENCADPRGGRATQVSGMVSRSRYNLEFDSVLGWQTEAGSYPPSRAWIVFNKYLPGMRDALTKLSRMKVRAYFGVGAPATQGSCCSTFLSIS